MLRTRQVDLQTEALLEGFVAIQTDQPALVLMAQSQVLLERRDGFEGLGALVALVRLHVGVYAVVFPQALPGAEALAASRT